jgi:hypothetical protein
MLRPGRSKLASLLPLDFGLRLRRHGMLGLGLLIVACIVVVLVNQVRCHARVAMGRCAAGGGRWRAMAVCTYAVG